MLIILTIEILRDVLLQADVLAPINMVGGLGFIGIVDISMFAEPRGRRVAMGNSWWNNQIKDATPLNIESLRKVFDYLGSDEHFKKEVERAEAVSFAMKIIVEAQEAGRITEDEMWRLLGSTEINGGLIVNEQMKKKLIGESNG